MNRDDERDLVIQALRDRLSRLSEASRRINESLDFDTVLQRVLASARDLTRSRYGVFILLDDAGRMRKFFGSGMTPEQGRRLWPEPDRVRFFDYVGRIQKPLRLRDFHSHARTLGLPEFPPAMTASSFLSFLAAPIRHRGEHLGTIYLDEKEGEYTQEDEETLVLFASQAALVIVNARRYRDEQRARARLETLIDTSPVGVAVFDGQTGAPVSFNREAVRIVDTLRDPDQPPVQLLDVLSFRRADGRQVALFDIAKELIAGDTVRSEEILIEVPDGRSVTTLVNGTPIRGEDGRVVSVVLTLQDMTALEELERLRAEFLAMVSHELRTPLTSVKGSIVTLLDPPSTLGPTEMRQFFRIIDSQIDRMHVLISDLLDVARIETGTLAVSPEPTDAAILVREASNGFRSGGGRHYIEIDIAPDLPWVMADRLRMAQVLGNLLTNAAKHSPESSVIRVTAVREGVHVAVSVSDHGQGISAESLPHLFRKFSRIESQEQGSDTGLGLAICKGLVEALGGRIWAESDGPELGARFTFTLPTIEQAGYVSPVAPSRPSSRSRRRGERLRILAVDDDPQALRYVRDTLMRSGFEPMATADPDEALRLVEEYRPHLVLLDLVLPGVDGIDLMKDIAEMTEVPVIFLSAYGQDKLVVRALDMGAADYMVKPFSPTELSARIRAALRRREVPRPSEPYVLADLTIDYDERRVTLAGRPVELTAKEYGTLAELSGNAGRVLTYETLLRRVWGLDADADIRPMRTTLSSIRRKLDDDAHNPTYIITERRIGYRMPRGNKHQVSRPGPPTAGASPTLRTRVKNTE